MTLPAFEIHRPATLEEASQLATELGDEAAYFCGGTELLLVMKMGFAPYSHLIDIKSIAELSGIDADESLWIGATATHAQVERHPDIRNRWPGLAAMAATIGNVRVRNVGTLGGNLCFAEPHSDPATCLLAAGATLECRRAGESARTVPIKDFVTGPLETALRPGELLVGVRVPALDVGAVTIHRKIRFHERAAVALAVTARVVDNRVDRVRLAVGAVGNRAQLVPEATELLEGATADAIGDATLAEVGDAAVLAGQPVDDAFGSVDYKSHLVRVLVRRTLVELAAPSARTERSGS